MLSAEFLSTLFLGRTLLYLQGLFLVTGMTIIGDTPVGLPIGVGVFVLITWWQARSASLPIAWATDMVFCAVVLGGIGESPVAFTIIVGWAGLIGLVDMDRWWVYPVGTGAVAGSTAAIISINYFSSLTAALNAIGAASITAFFVYSFRKVGDILRSQQIERERLATVVDSTSDLVALADLEGTVLYSNQAAQSWVRRHVSDDEYANLSQSIAPESINDAGAELESAGEWVGTVTIPGRAEPRTVSVAIQLLDMGGTPTIASIARDVTDEVETERKLKSLLRAKDELVASISHEIRTPLSVVLGLASELSDSYGDFDAQTHRELATLIVEQGQEMANIVEDLLVAARGDLIVLVPSVVDLRVELDNTIRSLSGTGLPVLVANDVDAQCWADPSRVRQILRNLATNAARYGGKVTATTEVHDGMVHLAFSDDGPGIPGDDPTVIFEPFERAHDAGTQPGSIGLGLSVSRDLARKMGGDLTYARVDDQSVFSLILPASPSTD